MTSISATPSITTSATTPPSDDGGQVQAGGGVQGAIGDLLRGAGAGYAQATSISAVQADKAGIVPFETVMTGTGLLKDKTAHIKGVNKATNLLNTIAGFGMLIVTSNVSGTVRAPGQTAQDLANHVADAIDGRKTAQGWNLGWGVVAGQKVEDTLPKSDGGDMLDNLGMR